MSRAQNSLNPGTRTRSRYSDVDAVMYRLLRSSSPKVKFAQAPASRMTPSDVARRIEDMDAARAAAVDDCRGCRSSCRRALPAPSPSVTAHTAPPLRSPLRLDVEHPDVLALGVVDEQARFVEREAQAVRLDEIVGEQRQTRRRRRRCGRRPGTTAPAVAARRRIPSGRRSDR